MNASFEYSAGVDLWSLVDGVARAHPDAIAVRDANPARQTTYRELLAAAEEQSAALARAGVRVGDRVAVTVRRSAREVASILAVLRLGAAFVAIAPDDPPRTVAAMLRATGVRIVLGERGRLAALGVLNGLTALPVPDRIAVAPVGPVPPAAQVPGRATACVTFARAATGPEAGVPVARSAIVRLADRPAHLRDGAARRFARLAPLTMDAALLEIFAPLLASGTIEVFPVGVVTPDALASFLHERAVTGLYLHSAWFRQVADYRPDTVAALSQLLVGGGAIAPGRVARVLRSCPGLRVTLCHGATPTGLLAAVHHLGDVAEVTDPLPIGHPLAGIEVEVRDGELYVYPDGLVAGTTAEPFPTGDLVRRDEQGRLVSLGRRDRRVSVNGVPVDPDRSAEVIRQLPWVRGAVVLPVADRLIAGVVAPDDPALGEVLRAHAAEFLPREAIPSRWALVAELPRAPDGAIDAARLAQLASDADPVRRAARIQRGQRAEGSPSAADVVSLVVRLAWEEVLGKHGIDADVEFFDVGGSSTHMLRLRGNLRQRLPGVTLTVQDLYRYPTIAALAGFLRGQPAMASFTMGTS